MLILQAVGLENLFFFLLAVFVRTPRCFHNLFELQFEAVIRAYRQCWTEKFKYSSVFGLYLVLLLRTIRGCTLTNLLLLRINMKYSAETPTTDCTVDHLTQDPLLAGKKVTFLFGVFTTGHSASFTPHHLPSTKPNWMAFSLTWASDSAM